MPTVAANNKKQDGSFMLYIYLTLSLAQAIWCTYIKNVVKVTIQCRISHEMHNTKFKIHNIKPA